MSEENSFYYAEYAKPVAKKGKNKQLRLLLILSYILFAILYSVAFTVLIKLPQVIAILPLFLWMAVYFTWGIVSYECAVRVSEGKLSFLKLRGKKEKLLLSFAIKEASVIAPYAEKYTEPLKAIGASPLDFRADSDSKECYYAIVAQGEETKAVIFDAAEKVIHSLYYYNKNTVKDTEFIKR